MSDTVVVNANITITVASLQNIVANAKASAPRDEKGYYQVDTADKVNDMISKFLREKDFEGFTNNSANYLSYRI